MSMEDDSRNFQHSFDMPSWYQGVDFSGIFSGRRANGNHKETQVSEPIFEIDHLSAYYDETPAFEDVNLTLGHQEATAIIGPSGCGKTTLLWTLNLMSQLNPSERVEGQIRFFGKNINTKDADPIEIRSRIGMVFQKPNPFPKTIYENIAFGLRLRGVEGADLDMVIEKALQDASLWDEVKSHWKTKSALRLSGGQQQRLCIARAIAVQPEVLLMDEPCSALDPTSTYKIEELIHGLKAKYTVIMTTHNMQQAARVADHVVVMHGKPGRVIEEGPAEQVFLNPHDRRTQNFIEGKEE
jgi:phosphate transport system ATP-binding protein